MFFNLTEQQLVNLGVSSKDIEKLKKDDSIVNFGSVTRSFFYDASEKFFQKDQGVPDRDAAILFVNKLINEQLIVATDDGLYDEAYNEISYRINDNDEGIEIAKEFNDLATLLKEAVDEQLMFYPLRADWITPSGWR